MDFFVDSGYTFGVRTPLLEVFSVTVSKQPGVDRRSELYGTIRVTDGHGTDAALYVRDLHKSESVNPNETLTLRGRPQCLSALTGFTIHVNLKDVNQDLEIQDGKIHWDHKNALYYDKKLAVSVPSLNGFATVNCVIFSVLIQAVAEILLSKRQQSDVNNDTAPDVEIYGTIVASYGKMFDYS